MSTYEVLARKYRPQQFEEIVGQDHIVRTLKNAIAQKRIAHAYLFVGPRGTGKTTTARIFAKALNCSGSKEPTQNPCDQCSNCKEIMLGTSMDVLEIDGASNNGIDQIRELRETVRYAPAKSRYKLIYIDEVHMVTTAAFNALLKTLEEPPPHVKFLFATTDSQKIPLTILSRCQRFDLHRIPNDLIVSHLSKIAKLEKVTVSDTALLAVARGAAGGMRDAESALDQLIAFCGGKVEEQDVLSVFGLAARDQIRCLTRGILRGERGEIVHLASALSDEGKDLSRLLNELIGHFRNILILQSGAQPTEVTSDEIQEITEHAKEIHRSRALRILEVLTEAESQMRWATSKKILFEITLIKAIETKDEVLIDDILKKLKGWKETGALQQADSKIENISGKQTSVSSYILKEPSNPIINPVLSSQRKEVSPPHANKSIPPPNIPMDELWKKVLEQLAKSKPMLKSNMMEGRPISMNADTLIIGFDREFELQKELVDTPKSRELIQAVLRELTHKAMNVKVAFADDSSIPRGDEPGLAGRDGVEGSFGGKLSDKTFEGDPLIKKALEVFQGQIIEIRR